ncbi:hypothetical protein CI15_18685 [Paraburkholderia monticola]|uniref:Uncharacterized protein n=1 Tax=Paraburkholderia monticola TaxID=1399968 RepID=A0A149PN24_9BURK|nr:hypothetical protein CI15_18685 [Paraburkholderia monticola]
MQSFLNFPSVGFAKPLLTLGVGNNPNSIPEVISAKGGRWYIAPLNIEPQRGKISGLYFVARDDATRRFRYHDSDVLFFGLKPLLSMAQADFDTAQNRIINGWHRCAF